MYTLQNPPDIIDGQNQDVVHYIMSYTSRDGNTQSLTISADDACTSEGHCAYNISVGFNSMDYYTITLSAVNLVGEGEPCVCSQQICTLLKYQVLSVASSIIFVTNDKFYRIHCVHLHRVQLLLSIQLQ